jgi:hypothetical protein
MAFMGTNPIRAWKRTLKHEIAVYGTTIEREQTGIDMGVEVARRAAGRPSELKERYMMIEDDMTHMADVFLNRQLPYAEYLIESDYHPISKGGGKALADMRDKYGCSFIAKYSVPRPDGRFTEVSVICGMMFYCRKDAPYEIMVYDGREDNDPYGYQTDEDLMILIAKLLGESE